MGRWKRWLHGFLLLMLFGVVIISRTDAVWAVNKVTLSPSSASLTEGDAQTINVTLSDPIIGPGPNPPYFNLNLTSSDTSRVTISPNPVTYLSSEWTQTKTFTITVLHDGVHNTGNAVTVSFIVDSDSEYYRNYSGSLVVTITDVDPAQAAVTAGPSTQASQGSLAETGVDVNFVQIISGLTFVFSSMALLVLWRRNKTLTAGK